jgi:cytoskeletal protein CcmA (bactofilin family)
MGIASLFQSPTVAGSQNGERSSAAPGQRGATFIGSTVRLVGTLRSDHDVMVQGRVEGPLLVTGQVLVGAGGQVDGEIRANVIRVRGCTRGALVATKQVSLEAGSDHHGIVRAPALVVEEGAQVDGEMKVGTGRAAEDASGDGALGDAGRLRPSA